MLYFIVFYIIGIVISFCIQLKLELKSNDITVRELIILFLYSLLSWAIVLVCIGITMGASTDYLNKKENWDKVIIHKKK